MKTTLRNQQNLLPIKSMNNNIAYPTHKKSRQVTLSVGGLQAGKRVDYVPDLPTNKAITTSTHVNQPQIISTSYPTYNQYPQGRQYHHNTSIVQNDLQTSSANNYPVDNRQFHQNIAYNDQNRIVTSQATGYEGGNRLNTSGNLNRQNNQMKVRASAGYPYSQDSDQREIKTKKKGGKCCGPLLWALLGLLALAALIIGLLFLLGVLGGHKDEGDGGAGVQIIQGIEYPSATISVQKTIISNNGQDNTDYQFPNNNGYSVSPIPVNPTVSISPLSISPVPINGQTYSNVYEIPARPIRKASKTITPYEIQQSVDPIKITPTRSVNTVQEQDESIKPIEWVLDRSHPGYFIPETSISSG